MKSNTGLLAYHSGLAAEKQVAAEYRKRGYTVAHERWRGRSGEIDLVVRDGTRVIFVEVKKSISLGRAAQRLSRGQKQRIFAAGSEFMSNEPLGQLTEIRFDAALVDQAGQIEIIENAFGHD